MQSVNGVGFPRNPVRVVLVLRPSKENDYNFDAQLEEAQT